nr:NACHT domain-containing protein [Candidatus Cloacimonadota bacterium]
MSPKQTTRIIDKDLVRYSRAGDVFHYRWAARRCLRMIHPNSQLYCITIEGSKKREEAGEYVIDVAEYSNITDKNIQKVAYFQLKHTTKRKKIPFKLSDLQGTIEGFAQKYISHSCDDKKSTEISFNIITNRPISERFRRSIYSIIQGKSVNSRFQKTLEKYTLLKDKELSGFCNLLVIADGEGDYNSQKHQLHKEMSHLFTGYVDKPQIDSITALVQEKALPDSDGQIIRENILQRFGVTSERYLFPAPPQFDNIENSIPRKQLFELLDYIIEKPSPIIIHASGGVGKTVFARQIIQSLPVGSYGFIYDSFGRGNYRNRSHSRHRHRDALIQIANEIASQGLCDSIVAQTTSLDDEIMRKFQNCLKTAIKTLKKVDENALLLVLIDAADNAENAAKEYNESCFAHELLSETLPEGCKLIMLCRTENVYLLRPSDTILQLKLEPFSEDETFNHLNIWFPHASPADGLEFHRLTNGNPRVQANILNMRFSTIQEVLTNLGPTPKTVENQINDQLDFAISKIKKQYSLDYQRRIDAICLGLANLPPFIPLRVLAKSANVDESMVKSFIADLGRPLWLTDTSVQFRDEPTETWFRTQYSASSEQIATYVALLRPLAYDNTYVSETLPLLLLQAGMYNELIELALSDDYLPPNDPLNERNIRIFRLQFAFKAAIKANRIADASKIAMRAGEEMAGDERQYKLLKKNVDLIAPLQSNQKVQELAFKRLLRSGWDGSENVYTASLLSTVNDYKGEARSYLRAANNWLDIYFKERRKSKEKQNNKSIEDNDILEMSFTCYKLFGVENAVNFILRWRPALVIYRITLKLCRKLIDIGKTSAVYEMASFCKRKQYMIIAISHALNEVGKYPNTIELSPCLILLTCKRIRVHKPKHNYDDTTLTSIISFLEACAARKLSHMKIVRVINHYFPSLASMSFTRDYNKIERRAYLRAVALKCVILEDLKPDIDQFTIKKIDMNQKKINHNEKRELKEVIGGLLPYYIARVRIIINDKYNTQELITIAKSESQKEIQQRWKEYDIIPFAVNNVLLEILKFSSNSTPQGIKKIYNKLINDDQKVRLRDRLEALRYSIRLDHLSEIRDYLERSVYDIFLSLKDGTTEERANLLIKLARAVLPISIEDAACYFNDAIEVVSKFGDEIYP